MSHKQVFTKVNVLIDVGISGIISALNEFSELETIESCEGDAKGGLWLCFKYGQNGWSKLVPFILDYLAPNLYEEVGDDISISIQIKPSGNILGEMSIRYGAAIRVEKAIRTAAQKF